MEYEQHSELYFEANDLLSLQLSVPFWPELSEPPANEGFVRHGVPRAESRIPGRMKVPYLEHVARLSPDEHPLMLIGVRNAMQNLFLPAYCSTQQPQLLCRVDEPWQHTEYPAFVQYADGSVGIEMIRFRQEPDSDGIRVEVLVDQDWITRDVNFAFVGQRIGWDYKHVPYHVPYYETVGLTYDLRHCWRGLNWEQRDDAPPPDPRDVAIHQELMETLMSNLHSPVPERGQLLCDIAARHNLVEQDGYYHNSISVTEEGGIKFVAKHASFRALADAHFAGSGRTPPGKRILLLDNGGSVSFAGSTRPGKIQFAACNSYFRDKAHALLAIRHRPFVEGPFRRDLVTPRRRPKVHRELLETEPRKPVFIHAWRDEMTRCAVSKVLVSFDDPTGVRQAMLPISGDRNLDAHYAAVEICNHGLLCGTKSVYVDSDTHFVKAVDDAFTARFDQGTSRENRSFLTASLGGYFSHYHGGAPFEIRAGRLECQAGDNGRAPSLQMPRGTAIGVDIGFGSIKLGIRRAGRWIPVTQPIDTPEASLEGLKNVVAEQIVQLVEQQGADDVQAIGIAWPGAVRESRIAGNSKILRLAEDILDADGVIDLQKMEPFFRFADRVRDATGIECPAFLVNDGNVDAFLASRKEGLSKLLVFKLGTSIGGGYVDDEGCVDYMTELGRICFEPSAPPDAMTRLRGPARERFGSGALRWALLRAGYDSVKGTPMGRTNSGKLASVLLDEGSTRDKKVVRGILTDMGEQLAYFADEIGQHLDVAHVLLSGGLCEPRFSAGAIVVTACEEKVRELGGNMEVHAGGGYGREYGAQAAAVYALEKVGA